MSGIWRTCASLGYKAWIEREESDSTSGGMTLEVSVDPLDPIDRELVCGAKTKRMLEKVAELDLEVLEDALKILCCGREEDAPEWYQEFKTRPETNQKVNLRFSSHMHKLRTYTVLAKRPAEFALFTAGYFAVAKSGPKKISRSIFSGKKLSKRCPVPPSVNLIGMRELIQKMAKHGAGKKKRRKYNVLMGDFRHWFHQLEAPEWMQRLFCLRHNETTLAWRSMPMGWSWSPFFAQAAAWSFLAHRAEGEAALLDESVFKKGHGLPRWVRTPQGGFVTVYYDNFIVVTPDANELAAWESRVETNAERLHVVIKEGSKQVLNDDQVREEGFEFLGIRFQTFQEGQPGRPQPRPSNERPDASTTHRGESGLRVTPGKREAWLQDIAKADPGTLRTAASWIGKGIFAAVCSGEAIQKREAGKALIEAARKVGVEAREHGWSTKAAGPTWEIAKQAALAAISGSEYTISFSSVREQSSGGRVVVVASDASTRGYGWVTYERAIDGRLLEIAAPWAVEIGRWEGPKVEWHIFLKELETAVEAYGAVRAALNQQGAEGARTKVVAVTDNSASYYAIGNGFTSSRPGQRIIDSGLPMEDQDQIVQVVSGDNPSDCHSRGTFGDYTDRVSRLRETLDRHFEGGRMQRPHAEYRNREATEVRHGEPQSDDEEAEMEEEVELDDPEWARAMEDENADGEA